MALKKRENITVLNCSLNILVRININRWKTVLCRSVQSESYYVFNIVTINVTNKVAKRAHHPAAYKAIGKWASKGYVKIRFRL